MYNQLLNLERPIRVVVTGGAGHMGSAILHQLKLSPNFQLIGTVDKNSVKLEKAIKASGFSGVMYGNNLSDLNQILDLGQTDVLVEATNSLEAAAKYCLAAIERKIHVILMNSEIDLLLGPLLLQAATENGVILSSDCGDQYGVLSTMIDEIKLWGFKIVMAGNIKGFLNQYATGESLVKEAAIRRLNLRQCIGYSDGTKLSIEMSLLCNAYNFRPWCRGMEGPRCDTVDEALDKFDFTKYGDQGIVDYILGAQPGGGVFVVGYCDDPIQQFYLNYYKRGKGPFYLFYRPYHLCHLETPRAIASAFLYKKPIMVPQGKPTDVYTFAKKDLPKGAEIREAIGSDNFYGMIDKRSECEELVPIALFESEAEVKATVIRPLKKDQPVTWDDVAIEETELLKLYRDQEVLLAKR